MSKLHLLWTTGEKEVAMKVIFPYLINAKANGWWDDINLIIWGPSAQLTAGDRDIHRQLQDVWTAECRLKPARPARMPIVLRKNSSAWESQCGIWEGHLRNIFKAGTRSSPFRHFSLYKPAIQFLFGFPY